MKCLKQHGKVYPLLRENYGMRKRKRKIHGVLEEILKELDKKLKRK